MCQVLKYISKSSKSVRWTEIMEGKQNTWGGGGGGGDSCIQNWLSSVFYCNLQKWVEIFNIFWDFIAKAA